MLRFVLALALVASCVAFVRVPARAAVADCVAAVSIGQIALDLEAHAREKPAGVAAGKAQMRALHCKNRIFLQAYLGTLFAGSAYYDHHHRDPAWKRSGAKAMQYFSMCQAGAPDTALSRTCRTTAHALVTQVQRWSRSG